MKLGQFYSFFLSGYVFIDNTLLVGLELGHESLLRGDEGVDGGALGIEIGGNLLLLDR